MREIKFRGKRLDNGEWVYGDLMQLFHNAKCMSCAIYSTQVDEVDVATVGQFTGSLDCEGGEIYEGDVLDVQYSIHVERENVCVVFGNNEVERTPGFYFSDNGTNELGHTWDFRDFLPDLKVIGNIHDNPELLKQ